MKILERAQRKQRKADVEMSRFQRDVDDSLPALPTAKRDSAEFQQAQQELALLRTQLASAAKQATKAQDQLGAEKDKTAKAQEQLSAEKDKTAKAQEAAVAERERADKATVALKELQESTQE